MKDALLVLLGAIVGVVIKALIDPIIAARNRKPERRERWLEESLEHSHHVLGRIREIRNANTARLGFDLDQISRAILRSLTPADGPEPLVAAGTSAGLKEFVTKAEEAWRTLRIATMDDEHGASAAEEIYEPIYAVQGYETALGNFASAARKVLIG